jgi:hypothetical protein
MLPAHRNPNALEFIKRVYTLFMNFADKSSDGAQADITRHLALGRLTVVDRPPTQ